MKIALGSDHAGFAAKEEVKKFLADNKYEVIDVGTYTNESCNYAEFGIKAAELVKSKECEYGVIICGSGEGISIAANKVKGVRAGIGYNDDVSRLLKEHNDANVIGFGEAQMELKDVLRRVDIFIDAKFQGERHERRVNIIKDYETK